MGGCEMGRRQHFLHKFFKLVNQLSLQEINMETAMRNVSIKDRTTPSVSPVIQTEPSLLQPQVDQLLQDQPIDFSTKVRARDHVDSQEDAFVRKVSNDSAIDCSNDTHEEDSRPAASEPVEDQSQSYPSQPRFIPGSMPMPNINSFLPQTTSAGVGMFYPTPPVFPNFLPPSFAAGPMWPNPMAAMLQQQHEVARKIMSANGKARGPAVVPNLPNTAMKASFGNRQFGKQDASVMAPGSRPFAPLPGFPNPANLNNIPDPNILAEALKSHEEMFSAYKQQVLSQKAVDDAKKGTRRPAPSTFTNGSTASVPSTQSNSNSTISETCTLSQINEDQPVTDIDDINTKHPENSSNGVHVDKESPSSLSDDEKASGGSVGELNNGSSGSASAAAASRGQSLHSSDESLQTNDSRASYMAAHSSGSEQNDITGMRPRSMTLPTQSDHRLLSHSPSPSVVSTGNNSSGPGTPNSKNERGFRKRARTLPDDQKVKDHRDEAYWERRRKNNEAAKRSRDSRRAKEDEIAIRAAFLEQENIRLRLELAALKTQTAKLRSELVIFQGPDESGAADGS